MGTGVIIIAPVDGGLGGRHRARRATYCIGVHVIDRGRPLLHLRDSGGTVGEQLRGLTPSSQGQQTAPSRAPGEGSWGIKGSGPLGLLAAARAHWALGHDRASQLVLVAVGAHHDAAQSSATCTSRYA
jgi:hypothetical protein